MNDTVEKKAITFIGNKIQKNLMKDALSFKFQSTFSLELLKLDELRLIKSQVILVSNSYYLIIIAV